MKLLIAFIISVLGIAVARADLLIEPAVGYSFGKFDDKTVTGSSYGGRLGYQVLGLQLGLDYLQSSFSAPNGDSDSFKRGSQSDFAAFVGYRFPVLFKVYAGYIFNSTATSKGNEDGEIKYKKGTGQKFGLGFTGIPFVDINFEYRRGEFGEFKQDGITDEDGAKFSAFMVGISIPLTF